jgi:hypothetical protein
MMVVMTIVINLKADNSDDDSELQFPQFNPNMTDFKGFKFPY